MEKLEKKEKDVKDLCKDKLERGKPDKIDRYQEVAEEIASVIKDDLFESTGFDATGIADILRGRFNINNEEIGRVLISEVTMFYVHSGNTFTIPMFGMLMFSKQGVMPIISGISFPNYNIRNRYMGYTDNNLFHRVNWWTEFVNELKRNPSLILISIFGLYIMMHTLLNLL
jgi:hypothetical protein